MKEYKTGTSRIEAFSDGVFAIVVTLLVIEIGVPHMPDKFSSHVAIHEIYLMLPKFISFILSFAIIAIFWTNHHQLFHSLEKSDSKFLWINNLLLFWVSFIPFPTAFIGEYPHNIVPVIFYGTILLFASVTFNILISYAAKKNLYYSYISDKNINKRIIRGRIGPAIYFLSVISAFFSVYISIFLFLLVPILYIIPHKIEKAEQ